MGTAEEICYMPATEMAAAIRGKKLSPVEVVEAVLSRIEQLNPKINAFCTLTSDTAHQAAKEAEAAVMQGKPLGPLHG
ncbi:MAG: amidase, partial [Candidatus Tectomicrobia bacterium]|nr:amidase [Candidatus Tectomicrobia bacterium]